MRQVDEDLPAQQQACVLWTAHSFASGKCHEVETHAGVLPQIRDRRHVGGSVQVARNLVLVRHSQPLFPANLCAACDPILVLRSVEKIRHHRVACAARALIVVERDHLGHPRAAEVHGAVILIAMRPLHDDLILLAVDRLRHIQNVDVVGMLQAGGSGQADGSRSSRSHDRPLALEATRDVLACLLLQIVQTHRMKRGLLHRRQNLRRHAGSRQRGIGAGGVDNRRDPKLRIVILTI